VGSGESSLEGVGVIQFGDIYRGRRVLVTGHTGFKGSWLTVWLNHLGARVCGISLDPESRTNHWDLINPGIDDHRMDIRDMDGVMRVVESFRPEVVFHLAAQPLVRRSYKDPIETWSTNVMGTANVLEACRQVDSVRAVVAITTDKVYANQERTSGYREDDRLGGHDPYSASKAACELLIDSYRKAFFGHEDSPLLASARAGNVIGGGDWSEDRLVPDLVRSISDRQPLVIRSPKATRPWQHVLECLAGYMMLGQGLLENRRELATAWNFGPPPEDNRTVEAVLSLLQTHWPELRWEQTESLQPHETTQLYLDHTRARVDLNWQPIWNLDRALQATADWYRQFHEKAEVITKAQLSGYVESAQLSNACWVQA
jgi:CDP-glucose 4,6-dehydratase